MEDAAFRNFQRVPPTVDPLSWICSYSVELAVHYLPRTAGSFDVLSLPASNNMQMTSVTTSVCIEVVLYSNAFYPALHLA